MYMLASENISCLFLSGDHSLDGEQWHLFEKCQLHPSLLIKYSVTKHSEYFLAAAVFYLDNGVGSEQCSSISNNTTIVQKHIYWMKGFVTICKSPVLISRMKELPQYKDTVLS